MKFPDRLRHHTSNLQLGAAQRLLPGDQVAAVLASEIEILRRDATVTQIGGSAQRRLVTLNISISSQRVHKLVIGIRAKSLCSQHKVDSEVQSDLWNSKATYGSRKYSRTKSPRHLEFQSNCESLRHHNIVTQIWGQHNISCLRTKSPWHLDFKCQSNATQHSVAEEIGI